MFTGPVDEIFVLGGIIIFGAYQIYKNGESQDFSGALSLSYDRTLERFNNQFSKKKDKGGESTPKEKPSALPKDGAESGKEGYKTPPKDLPWVPDAKPAKPKTPKQGENLGKRKRWKDSEGNIYEWDYQHGDVEKYNKRGKHLGSIDPETGKQTKSPVNGREVEP